MPTDFWSKAECRLGGRIAATDRRYVAALMKEEPDSSMDEAIALEDWIDGVVSHVEAMRAAEIRSGVLVGRSLDDKRWGLQIALNNEFRRQEDIADDSALRRPWTLALIDGVSVDVMQEPMSRKISISFDARLPQEAVFALLRQGWSDLTRPGIRGVLAAYANGRSLSSGMSASGRPGRKTKRGSGMPA